MPNLRDVVLGAVLVCLTGGPARAADEMAFEIFKDKAGEYRWRLKATGGAIMATPGEGYKAHADAKRGVELVKKSAADDKMKYEVYEDAKKEYRWRLKAANGQIIAVASEGYSSKAGADRAVETVKAGVAKATASDVKE